MADDGQVCGSGDMVGGQADEDVGLQGGLGRQQESCSWRFSAFSGLEIHTLSRSSSRGSNRCCNNNLIRTRSHPNCDKMITMKIQ